MTTTEIQPIGVTADFNFLKEIADRIDPAKGAYVILRGTFRDAADPYLRHQPGEWIVQRGDEEIVFRSRDRDAVAAFLAALTTA